jgi:hypothetical protein
MDGRAKPGHERHMLRSGQLILSTLRGSMGMFSGFLLSFQCPSSILTSGNFYPIQIPFDFAKFQFGRFQVSTRYFLYFLGPLSLRLQCLHSFPEPLNLLVALRLRIDQIADGSGEFLDLVQ